MRGHNDMVDVHLHYRGAGDEWRAMLAVPVIGSYALEAERRMGELLAETPRAKGTKGQLKGKDSSGGHVTLPPENAPTLASLGITKRESSEAQRLAVAGVGRGVRRRGGRCLRARSLISVGRRVASSMGNVGRNGGSAK